MLLEEKKRRASQSASFLFSEKERRGLASKE